MWPHFKINAVPRLLKGAHDAVVFDALPAAQSGTFFAVLPAEALWVAALDDVAAADEPAYPAFDAIMSLVVAAAAAAAVCSVHVHAGATLLTRTYRCQAAESHFRALSNRIHIHKRGRRV